MPGNHASRIAGAFAATSVSVNGRPLNNTTTNGLPVAATASISSCCLPGRSRGGGDRSRFFRREGGGGARLGLAAHPPAPAERDPVFVGAVDRRGRPRR